MGAISTYTCKRCGYETDELSLGPGFAVYLEAFLCQDCHHTMSKPINDEWQIVEGHDKCDHCQGTNLVKWDYNCPNCGGFMEMETVGMWD